MSVFVIYTFDITDPEAYKKYLPDNAPVFFKTLSAHGGEIMFADPEATYLKGEKRQVNVGFKFPSVEAYKAWDNDPEYATIKGFRLDASDNYTVFIANEFVAPN